MFAAAVLRACAASFRHDVPVVAADVNAERLRAGWLAVSAQMEAQPSPIGFSCPLLQYAVKRSPRLTSLARFTASKLPPSSWARISRQACFRNHFAEREARHNPAMFARVASVRQPPSSLNT